MIRPKTFHYVRPFTCLLVCLLLTAFKAAAQPSVYWGAYVKGEGSLSSSNSWVTFDAFEGDAKKSVSICNFFASWTSGTSTNGTALFPTTSMNDIRAHGSIPLFTWQPQNGDQGTTQSFTLHNITNGVYDSYITNWAAAAKGWGHPFFLRFAHEMNGNWYPWSEGVNGNTTGQYVPAWHHVHDLFTLIGATNVTWVWCVNTEYSGSVAINELYPGDNYVDWASFDAYNRGGKDFSTLVKETYDELNNLDGTQGVFDVAPGKPIMIAENGTIEDPVVPKAQWFTNALGNYMKWTYPYIKAYCYFNNDGHGYTNQIETSASSQAAFAWGIGLSYYTTNAYGSLTQCPIQPLTNDATAADTMPPFITVQQPSALTVAAGTTTNVVALASDKSGISKVDFYLNGAYQRTENLVPYTWSWSVPAGAGKHFYVTAKAYDGAGQMMTSTVYYVSQ